MILFEALLCHCNAAAGKGGLTVLYSLSEGQLANVPSEINNLSTVTS